MFRELVILELNILKLAILTFIVCLVISFKIPEYSLPLDKKKITPLSVAT